MTKANGERFERENVTFLLVHGTFAKSAQWTSPDSPLSHALATTAHDLGFVATTRAICWTGRNRVRDRIAAARKIEECLDGIDRDASPRVFLVGHSHGGSVIAHFLKGNDAARRVTGCAFLSTPFIATRVRPDAHLVYSSLLATSACVAFAILVVVLSILLGFVVGLFDNNFDGSMAIAASIQLVAALVVGFALRQQSGTFKRIIAACGAHLSEVETARIDARGCLFLRASSDEAAAALAFAQFVATVTGKTASVIMSLVGHSSIWFARLRSSRTWTAVILVLSLFYGFYAAFVIEHLISYATLRYLWSGAFESGIIIEFAPPWVASAFDVVLHRILWVPFSALTIVLVGSVMLYSATSIVNATATWAFGWANLLDAMLADVSVEPIPFGAHVLTHVSWSDSHATSSWLSMSHSATYQDPECLDALRAWLSSILRAEVVTFGSTSSAGVLNDVTTTGEWSLRPAPSDRELDASNFPVGGFPIGSKRPGALRAVDHALALWRAHGRTAIAAICMATTTGVFAWMYHVPMMLEWRRYANEKPFVRRNVRPLPLEREATLEPSGLPFQECVGCPQMIVLPAGRFEMGSARPDTAPGDVERPRHEVTIEAPFAVSDTSVTVEQWKVCVEHGDCRETIGTSRSTEAQLPAVWVNFGDAVSYVTWLSRITGKSYRLLTEAEWEYAARSNTSTPFAFDEASIGDYAWFRDNSGHRAHEVARKLANSFGLYDMQGNVWQWVEDCFHPNYDGAPVDGTAWIAGGDCGKRMIRGGDYGRVPDDLRSARREHYIVEGHLNVLGFRVARTLQPHARPTPSGR